MYKKIMIGMVLLIMFCTPLPSYASDTPFNSFWPDGNVQNDSTYDEYNLKTPYKIIFRTTSGHYQVYQISEKVYYSSQKLYPENPMILLNFSKTPKNPDLWYVGSFEPLKSTPIDWVESVVYANFDILRPDGSIYYKATNNMDLIEFEAKILTPWHDDYKDNGKTFAFQGMFRLPSDVQRTDVKITGTVDDSKETYWINEQWRESYVTNTGSPNVKPYFSFNFALTVYDYGIHTYKLVFEQVSTGKKLGEVTRRFESLEGFIDENGDGLDDRTNQPPYTPLDPPGTNPGTSPEWDGTILGFFKYLIDSVKYYVENIVSGINTTIRAIGKVPQIMGTILNFPEPLTALLIFGVTCTIILAIFRR